MTQVGSTEYKALLNQMQGVFGQLSSSGAIKGSSYLNSVWGAAGNVEGLVSDNPNQKSSAIQGLINNVLSLVEKLGNQEASRARKEVKEGEKAAQELTEEQKKALSELNQSLEEIGSDIENKSGVVSAANGTLDASQQELEEKQEEINKIIEQIQKKQEALKSTTDPAMQKALLGEIQGLSGQIAGIVSEIEAIQANVQAAAESVEQAVVEIETAKGNAVEVQENGELKISELVQQGAEKVANTTQTQVTGVENGIVAKALEAQATTTSILPGIGTAASAKLSQAAVDQEMASSVRTTGALGNLRTLMQGIGGLNENINLLNTFKNSIGGALETFNGCVGDYNTKIEPVITSIGSFLGDGGVAASTAELDAAVQADLQNIDSKLSSEEPDTEESSDETEATGEEPVQEDGNLSGLLTPDVEFNPFEIA